jgi:hypothetical protein
MGTEGRAYHFSRRSFGESNIANAIDCLFSFSLQLFVVSTCSIPPRDDTPALWTPLKRDGRCSLKFDTTVPDELQTVPLTYPEEP